MSDAQIVGEVIINGFGFQLSLVVAKQANQAGLGVRIDDIHGHKVHNLDLLGVEQIEPVASHRLPNNSIFDSLQITTAGFTFKVDLITGALTVSNS